MKEMYEKNSTMLRVENEWNIKLEELLRILYVDYDLPTSLIEKKLNISHATLLKWLKLAGIYSRRLDI